MVTKLLLLALLPWAGAFQSPWLGAASKSDLRLHTVPIDKREWQPCRAPTWQAVVDAIPDEVLTGIPYVTLGLNTLLLAGVDLPGIPAEYGPYVTLLGVPAAYYSLWLQKQKPRVRIEMMVREKLTFKYNPPASNAWSGDTTWTQEVETFVENDALRKTLVLVDPTGNAKPDLLDNVFRGQTNVISPAAMEKLTLSEDLCKFFGVKDRGIDAFANLIEKGIKPDLGGFPVTPAKLLVDLVDVDDDTKIRSVVKEVKLLKEKAGANVVTIITVANGAFVQALPQVTQSALQVLS